MGNVEVAARLRRDLPVIVALAGGVGINLSLPALIRTRGWGWDAHAYYLAAGSLDYSRPLNAVDAYLYSPVFVQAVRPLCALPWPLFAGLWSSLALLTLSLLLRGVRWPVRLGLLLFSLPEVVSGNVHWLIAAAVCWGLSWPACWSVPLLTKVTPAVGILWFAVRREWWRLGVAVLVPLLVGTISYSAEPHAWQAWVELLLRSATQPNLGAAPFVPPLPLRATAAVVLTVYAARSSRAWLVAVAVCLASPNWASPALVILYAIPRLRQHSSARLSGARGSGKAE